MRTQNRNIWDKFTAEKNLLTRKHGREEDIVYLWHGSRTAKASQITNSEEGFDMRFA
jgi:hypothetical protein